MASHVSHFVGPALAQSLPCRKPTLPHKILEMMPFDIVREIADVDAAVLLRRLADVGHDLLASGLSFFV